MLCYYLETSGTSRRKSKTMTCLLHTESIKPLRGINNTTTYSITKKVSDFVE
jgi:hypothetical protein